MVTETAIKQDIRKKIVIVGDGNCGKTCLYVTYVEGKMPEHYVPTVFETYVTDLKLDNLQFEISLYDTAGQDAYDRLRPLSYPDTDVMLVCFSVDLPDSLFNVYDKWVPEVRHFCPNIPIILVCSKVDLREDPKTISNLEKLRLHPITHEEGLEMAERVKANGYIECSSLMQYNIEEVFTLAVRSTIRKKENKKVKKMKQIKCQFL